jgi:cobaltochelatase CobS
MDITVVPSAPLRATARISLEAAFGLTFKSGISEDLKYIEGFASPGPLTPEIDPHYKFSMERLMSFLLALKLKDATYIAGHSGVGKSSFIAQVAARLNYNLVRINFDGNTRSSDLIGSMRAKDGATFFSHGVLINGFTLPGTIVLLDEVDACPPDAAFAMQRGLEDDHKILIRDTSEVFSLHPQNVIVATANTTGNGDESGLYMAGTNVQNFSFINRFGTVLTFDYMPKADEINLLSRLFPKFAESNIKAIENVAEIAHITRTQFASGNLSTPLTHRDTINWVKKMSVMPLPRRAAEYSFLNRMLPSEAVSVATLISSKFSPQPGDTTRFIKQTTT